MELKKFWNKAIEFYCTHNSSERLKQFDTVFISISEESLERVKIKYLNKGNLSEKEITIVSNNIYNAGGIQKSYYSSVREIHNDFNNPAQYSFLRFSILVVGAFRQDESPLKNYWKEFDIFLSENKIQNIPPNIRTGYLKKIYENLAKYCYIYHKKTFFQVNVFGDENTLINVGKIKAHSIFQGRSLVDVKKSIYQLGYSDTHNIEDLDFQDIEEILKKSGQTRILNLFKRDYDTKEIVLVCLKLWLKNWIPSQEEKNEFLKGKTYELKSKIQIHRIWNFNNNNEIEIKYGFILKYSLGEDNIYYLNKNNNIYVDVAWGIKINEFRTLYVIENYKSGININNNELGFNYKPCHQELNKHEYAIERIPNRMYFIEHTEIRVKIQDNPILLASKKELRGHEEDLFYTCKIKHSNNLIFNLYRIRESLDSEIYSFIKTNNLNIYPIGITEGKSGLKSYLSSFPIKIKYNNLSNGEIHILYNNEMYKVIKISNASFELTCEENIGYLKTGNYNIKYFKPNKTYDIFQNGEESIEFKIVDAGIGDRRIDTVLDTVRTFEYQEFTNINKIKNIDNSYIILYDHDSNTAIKDKHTFFYFHKNNMQEWIIIPNKEKFFIQRLTKKLGIFYEKFYSRKMDLEYLSNSSIKYNYKVSFCENSETTALNFNMNEFYQRNEECRITSDKIQINCYYYRLEALDNALKEKYPEVEIGDVIYIISNKKEPRPENLLKIMNQEVFPFKKLH